MVTRPFAMVTLVGGLLIVPFALVHPEFLETFGARAMQVWLVEGGIAYRVVLLEMAKTVFLQNPVTGIGSGGFGRQQGTLYNVTNAEFSSEYNDFQQGLSAHNTLFGVAAETGMVGLAAYLIWALAVFRFSFQTLRMTQTGTWDLFIVAACLLVMALTLSDAWGQASFTPNASSLLGFLLGWRRSQVAGAVAGSKLVSAPVPVTS